MPESRRILWSGGFDSTWLVVDALLAGARVEAVTWTGSGRLRPPSGKAIQEEAARASIVEALPPALRGRLGLAAGADAQLDGLIGPLWDELVAAQPGEWWSPQNYVLAALPRSVGHAEAGIVADDRTARQAGVLGVLAREGVSTPIVARGKADLLADARARGFEDLLALTWSCEAPDHAALLAPCGRCEACLARIVRIGRAANLAAPVP